MFYFYFFEFLLRFYHAHLIWPSLIVDNFLLFMNSRSILECFNSTVPNATLLLLFKLFLHSGLCCSREGGAGRSACGPQHGHT